MASPWTLSAAEPSIAVSGFGTTGACDGDSGGPLLIRGANGTVMVAGVLSVGSLTCTGNDTYVRLDTIGQWVQTVVGAYESVDRACGGIDTAGRCFYGDAVWCANGQIAGQACSGATSCGWDAAQAGYRCVLPTRDPCAGVDSVGTCKGNTALQCNGGELQRKDCGCNTCRIDGTSGAPSCDRG
jgi:Trypsin